MGDGGAGRHGWDQRRRRNVAGAAAVAGGGEGCHFSGLSTCRRPGVGTAAAAAGGVKVYHPRRPLLVSGDQTPGPAGASTPNFSSHGEREPRLSINRPRLTQSCGSRASLKERKRDIERERGGMGRFEVDLLVGRAGCS